MIERKHIEAISEAVKALYRIDAAYNYDLCSAAIDAALAACDESPCVWERIGGDGLWHPSCLGGHPHVSWSTWSRSHMARCPHCGRKIAEAPLPAAPEGV